MAAHYKIIDEPAPSRLSHLVVNPFWALLGLMLGGSWLGYPWFAFNSVAVGSATMRKELALAFAGFAGAGVIGATFIHFAETGVLTKDLLPYAGTILIVWKLGIGYALHTAQGLSFELYRYFGGEPRKGLLVVVGGFLLRPYLVSHLDSDFWFLVLA